MDSKLDIDKLIMTLEPMRARTNTLSLISKGFGLAAVLVFCFTWRYVIAFGPICFVGYIIFLRRFKCANKEYRENYKRLVVQHVLDNFFDNPVYLPETGFTPEEFQLARLIRWRKDFCYRAEDMVRASYKGVEFKQSDIKITHTEGSGKNRRTVTDVDGRLTRFQCPKDIKKRILIVKHAGGRATLEWKLNKVSLEDVDFNRQFDVYAEDEHSAFYLLTPHFMEHIKKLYSTDKNLYISYDGTFLYVLRSGKGGVFEPNLKQFSVGGEVEKIEAEIQEILDLIDILDVDEAVEQKKW